MFRRLAAIRSVRTHRAQTSGRSATIPSARGVSDAAGPTTAPGPTTAGDHADPEHTAKLPAPLDPGSPPDYFGGVPNFAYSPLPVTNTDGTVLPGTGIRKFVDSLPGLGAAHQNELGNYLPVAVPDTITYPGCDYYEIGLQEYTQRLHPDLPPTRLRGYRQLNNGTDSDGHNTIPPANRAYHLGPVILAHRDRPVRIKFINQLPVGPAGALFLPVDTTVPGAGATPTGPAHHRPPNRAVLHLHGGDAPWISAGNPDQWLTPAGESAGDPTGPAFARVPDMPDPGNGAVTLYYPNQQSGRLLWLRDNTFGLSRLNVYSGQSALYLLDDPVEQQLVDEGVLPAEQIPLVIQDRTFVPGDSQLATQDPTWDRIGWGARGSLWFPHVYQPNQHPQHESGVNPTGRWDYGPWLGPPQPGPGPAPNPRYDPVAAPHQPPVVPGVPHPSIVPEAFLDTLLINGAAYPYLQVEPKAYRFRILNACLDRAVNLQLYYARASGDMWHPDGTLRDGDVGEIPMVPAAQCADLPPGWPTDGRAGGVPDPAAAGPEMIQIGGDGGLLPAPVVLANQPIDYVYDRRDAALLNIHAHTLLLGPGERADVIVDFSSVPPGSTLILYNDCPAPVPAFDSRYDHYTGGPDQTAIGGAPTTRPGYGPNTRTLLQFRVAGAPAPPYDLAALQERLPAAYGASQPPPIVPQPAYDTAFGTSTPGPTLVSVRADSVTFTPDRQSAPVTLPVQQKTIVEQFEPWYGRLAVHLTAAEPQAGPPTPVTPTPGYLDPPTEVLLSMRAGEPDHHRMTGPPDPATVGRQQATGNGAVLWRVTNHSSSTDFIHICGALVQLVNRTGRDGSLRPPAANELGWKDTIRVDPAEDVVLAIRANVPSLPFRLGDNPATGTGADNLGWTYSWHSQLLSRAAYGMLRPLVVRVSPAAPTGLAATATAGSPTELPAIRLSWTNHADQPAATELLIQHATDPGFTTDVNEVRLPPDATDWADTSVIPGVTYYHRIRAENTVSHSTWSASGPAAAHLLSPTGLTATIPAAAPLRVGLVWTNRSFTEGVQVQRATNPTFTAGLASWSIPATSTYLDETVSLRTGYYYRIRTVFRGACSPWSNVATCHTPGPAQPPTQVTATATAAVDGPAVVELSWTDQTGGSVSGYVIQRSENSGFTTGLSTYTVVGPTCTFRNTGLARGRVYHYRVRAYNPAGSSSFSAPVAVTTPR